MLSRLTYITTRIQPAKYKPPQHIRLFCKSPIKKTDKRIHKKQDIQQNKQQDIQECFFNTPDSPYFRHLFWGGLILNGLFYAGYSFLENTSDKDCEDWTKCIERRFRERHHTEREIISTVIGCLIAIIPNSYIRLGSCIFPFVHGMYYGLKRQMETENYLYKKIGHIEDKVNKK